MYLYEFIKGILCRQKGVYALKCSGIINRMDIEVDKYIENQKSPQKEICKKLREIILETYPDIKEGMRWGVPSYENGKYYFVALKTHVNLGFSLKGLSKEEIALFEGSGKTMKNINIMDGKVLGIIIIDMFQKIVLLIIGSYKVIIKMTSLRPCF